MVNGYKPQHLILLCCCLVLVLAATGPASVSAQDGVAFNVDAISVRSEGSSSQTRLDLYTQIPFSQLSFINTPNGFSATYEVLAEVFQLDDRDRPVTIVQSPIWEHSTSVNTFALTQSDQQFDFTTHSLSLDPGRYLISFQITDKNSKENYLREHFVEVRDLSRSIALSDIVLLKEYDEETQTIYPHVSDELGANQMAFEIFYEIYADVSRQVQVTREVLPIRKNGSALKRVGRTILGLKDKPVDPAVLFSDSETTALSRGRHQVVSRIPLTELDMGDYLIRVQIQDEDSTVLDVSERMFSARWTGLAAHLIDLDQAIEQLAYHAKQKELRAIRNAPTYEERLRRFEAFWKKRDPTPGTGRNERMEEYYYRIDYANRKFGNVIPGWKTDRGHVLILHGYPDDIKRQTFSFGAEPWEVWYYYRIGRQFIFVDKTGFGDYELVVPIWDERTRIR